ncbi:tripartite tricarboxylate transporter substrate binding protein [Sporomusa sp.]|uniref:tripartite tricarboxylate transporter substrate binding protein n=1 Tax=Sporomusa sp. TaxID=2078658 RepID=UPI002C5C92BD|nr:tripartite tricarboxylate transporter substrate binding protein [Sporomusa sp.]HWR41919.1 tripartite tricarboxylate transporter substrate binding protein [Sporomusa sp.]
MRKTGSLLLAVLLVMSLIITGCGNKSEVSKQQQAVKYPTKAIELIVPYAAGGGTDAVGRALAEALKNVLKQDVVVINKTGGAGAVGMNEGLHAKADGYSITMVTREVAILPMLGQAPFKTLDFKYVSNVNVDPELVVVSSNSEYKTIEDLIAAMKANPGKLSFAAASTPNFYGIQFAQTAGVNFKTVPFQGAAPAMTEILGGRADFGIYNPGEVKAQIENGKLRPLAVMAEKRFEGLKDVPTFKEKGLDVICGTYRGIAVPPQTPDEVVKVLEDALAKAVTDPKFIEFMNKSQLGIAYKNPADFKSMVEQDMKVLAPIVEVVNKKQ